MSTRREQILQALAVLAAGVPGIAPSSLTRERAAPVAESDCPALDLAPESEPDPTEWGLGTDLRVLTVVWRIHTAGEGAYALADPIVQALDTAIHADSALRSLVTLIQPGSTDFARDDADQTIGRTHVRYRITYTTRRGHLAAA